MKFDKQELGIIRVAVALYLVQQTDVKIPDERPSERAMRVSEIAALWNRVKEIGQ